MTEAEQRHLQVASAIFTCGVHVTHDNYEVDDLTKSDFLIIFLIIL